jgi:predicted MPP superfamily phosphohydrolase
MALPFDAVALLALIFALPILALLALLSCLSYKLARRWRFLSHGITWVEKRWIFRPCAAFLAIYALCFAWGMLVEAHWVEATKTEISVDRPVLGHDRFRIVHLSDLHLERIGRREYRMVDLVREAKPHLILLTGDYMNAREGGAALVEILRALAKEARYGIYGVEGNWDPKFVTADLFRTGGADLIVDDTRLIERDNRRLRLVGHGIVPRRSLGELLHGLDDDAFTIYLQHRPDGVDELLDRGPGRRVDLFLCGHTHGGQVCLPFWGAVITLSKYHKKYERGLYDVQGVPMYVNRGVGMEGGAVPRVRFLARPEVAIIDLVAP